ncbi:hypothetical protein BDZ90DRAFT_282092 [Jaminaea rosea]|uniref:Sas10 C-terminal domain-containing protein n=1 Tax=Jaminaea rosea TaxID=1569628 RepID=A0A316UNM6_9BASI|nr:hypothetical protein BDZ90DRAFT_282092 [Jaminaea rosea]PWN24765.1 hypothetical protein BDZ90DRAFT_282092 [Jaminaea rosea]
MAKGKGSKSGSSGLPASSATLNRWNTADDIPSDDEERFHHNRDQVLLNGDDGDNDQPDAFANQREVLGLDESEADDSSADEGHDGASNDDTTAAPTRKSKQFKRLDKTAATAEPLSDSDVDVSSDEEEDISRWGSNKRSYYNTNDLDRMDSDSEIDEEQARELELNEVKRLQAKSRKGMEDADFGLGEADELGGAEQGGKGVRERERRRAELDEAQPAVKATSIAAAAGKTASAAAALPTDPVARASLLVQLQKDSPETVALAGDFADAVDQLIKTESLLKSKDSQSPDFMDAFGMHHMHYQALLAYVTTLAYYFRLRSLHASEPHRLRDHPVLARLLKLKEGLSMMESLDFAVPLDEEEDGEEEEEVEADLEGGLDDLQEQMPFLYGSEEDEDMGELDDDELAGLIADEKENAGEQQAKAVKTAKAKKPKTSKRARDAAAPTPVPVPAPLAGLADADDSLLLASSSRGSASRKSKPTLIDDGDAYGEATSLTASELADKAAKKKSLRFYTGQMDAKEARRGQAARDRMGGDADIPYRDRERSRQGVEQAKAAREGKTNGKADAALDGEDWGEGDSRDWREVMGQKGASDAGTTAGAAGDDDDDDYYDLITSSRREAKRAKKESHDAERDASRIVDDPDLVEGEDGSHRAINRQIANNKGLTRHRKQDRNLRVKKRKKYEKAQKKLSSTRAVYKGGQGALQGGYQGEASGINTGVAKSRRFAN